jgi:hypothetical protein
VCKLLSRSLSALFGAIVVFSLSMSIAFAQSDLETIQQTEDGQWLIPLEAMGYDQLRLNGQLAQREIFLPVAPGMKTIALTANVVHSLDIQSGYLEVYNNDSLLTQFDLENLPETLTIPLENAAVRDNQLPLRFVARLRSADDICSTSYTGAWLDLTAPALVLEGENSAPTTVADFMPPLLTRLTIVVSSEPTAAEAEAALQLSAAATQRYAGQKPAITVTASDELTLNQASPFERVIVIRESADSADIALQQGDTPYLLLSGTADDLRRQADFLAVNDTVGIAPEVSVVNITRPEQLDGEQISFEALQLNNLQVTGQGSLEVPLNFSQIDLGGSVQSADVRLTGSYTPVGGGNQGTLSILLNNTLLKAIALNNSGQFDLYVTLPASELRRDNTLIARFDYTPEEGQCRFGANSFTGQVNSASFFRVTRGSGSLTGFARFPQNSANGLTVALEPLNRDTLISAANLVMSLQKTSRVLLQPQIKPWADALQDANTALLLTNDAEQVNSLNPVMALEPLRVTDRDGDTLLEVNLDAGFAALQAFNQNGRDVLVAASRDDAPSLTNLTTLLLNDPQGWYALQGDVYLQAGDSAPAMLALQRSELQTQPITAPAESWFMQYRIVIFAALVALVIAFVVVVYPRVVRRTPNA